MIVVGANSQLGLWFCAHLMAMKPNADNPAPPPAIITLLDKKSSRPATNQSRVTEYQTKDIFGSGRDGRPS
jgi:hypothetical protein